MYPVVVASGARLAAPFTWSWSRYTTWRTCPRRFWLTVYAAPLGKGTGAPAGYREVFIQRHLVGRPQWIGLLVHQAAEWYLRALAEGRRVEPDGIVARAVREARRDVERSAAGLYRGDPAAIRGFDAHYYGLPFDGEAAVEAVRDRVAELFEHPVLERLAAVPGRIREVERLSRIRIAGEDVWVSPDVVVADGVGGFVIVDWKTGRLHHPDDVDGQLGVYGLYVLRTYLGADPERDAELPLARVKGLYAHTGDGAHRTVTLGVAEVDAAVEAVRSSAPAMKGLDVAARGDVPPEEAFPKVSAGDSACGWCSFRRTCGRE